MRHVFSSRCIWTSALPLIQRSSYQCSSFLLNVLLVLRIILLVLILLGLLWGSATVTSLPLQYLEYLILHISRQEVMGIQGSNVLLHNHLNTQWTHRCWLVHQVFTPLSRLLCMGATVTLCHKCHLRMDHPLMCLTLHHRPQHLTYLHQHHRASHLLPLCLHQLQLVTQCHLLQWWIPISCLSQMMLLHRILWISYLLNQNNLMLNNPIKPWISHVKALNAKSAYTTIT